MAQSQGLVIIMSGIPGSGKDSWIRRNHPDARVVSADTHFTDPVTGRYSFDPRELGEAHEGCLRRFVRAVIDPTGPNVIIVNNTNTTALEIAPYYAIANAFGFAVEMITLCCPPSVGAARNVHGVSLEACEAMARRIADRVLPPFWRIGDVRIPS